MLLLVGSADRPKNVCWVPLGSEILHFLLSEYYPHQYPSRRLTARSRLINPCIRKSVLAGFWQPAFQKFEIFQYRFSRFQDHKWLAQYSQEVKCLFRDQEHTIAESDVVFVRFYHDMDLARKRWLGPRTSFSYLFNRAIDKYANGVKMPQKL